MRAEDGGGVELAAFHAWVHEVFGTLNSTIYTEGMKSLSLSLARYPQPDSTTTALAPAPAMALAPALTAVPGDSAREFDLEVVAGLHAALEAEQRRSASLEQRLRTTEARLGSQSTELSACQTQLGMLQAAVQRMEYAPNAMQVGLLNEQVVKQAVASEVTRVLALQQATAAPPADNRKALRDLEQATNNTVDALDRKIADLERRVTDHMTMTKEALQASMQLSTEQDRAITKINLQLDVLASSVQTNATAINTNVMNIASSLSPASDPFAKYTKASGSLSPGQQGDLSSPTEEHMRLARRLEQQITNERLKRNKLKIPGQ